MKKILFGLACLVSTQVTAGTALINNWQIDSDGYTCIRLSNISAVDGELTVKLYTANGAEYTGPLHDAYLISSLSTPFTVPPQNTARFCVNKTGAFHVGYGTVESKVSSTNVGQVQFVGQALYHTYNNRFSYSIPINQGNAF